MIRIAMSALLMIFLFSPSAVLADEEVHLTLKGNRFQPEEVRVKSGVPIKLIVHNEDPAAEEFESSDLKQEKLIRPGKSVTLKLRPLKPGTYEFFGEFHPKTARGRLVVE